MDAGLVWHFFIGFCIGWTVTDIFFKLWKGW